MPKAFRWQISVCSDYSADCMQTVTLSPPHGHIMSPLYDCHVDTRQGGTVRDRSQRFQTQHFPIRAVFLPLDFKSPELFFWYELDPKLKLF